MISDRVDDIGTDMGNAMENDADFLESYLPYLLRRADQALSAPFYAVLTKYGVARSDWRVLAVLEQLGELTVLDLAAAALSPQPTVTHGSTLTRTLMSEAKALEADALSNSGDLAGLRQQLALLTESLEACALSLTAHEEEAAG